MGLVCTLLQHIVQECWCLCEPESHSVEWPEERGEENLVVHVYGSTSLEVQFSLEIQGAAGLLV